MLCDDSATIIKVLEKRFKDAGHEIVGKASDGEQGIQIYSQTKPDIAILDVTMPNKDGRECLAGIMKMDIKAKIIMISALKDDAVVSDCLKGGAKAFVSKDKIYKDDDFKLNVLSVVDTILKAA